ncbi:hypothetical protein FHT77_004621 [Rhizobium sp. BK181]|uniref:metallophosphoesterase family protein n=1 Tax=Rhizobium sp. BK181 TaxID=2587072 RepID=UPI00182321DF|nr:metallophosphoesterase [Rhizobium sp. BK181]MBB3318712.1 hypothetical protein [Rhizobium sp. BK181]
MSLQQVADEYAGSPCDGEWITCLEEYHRYFGPEGDRAEIPYIRPADVGDRIISIAADASIALMADWGTGNNPAFELLRAITDFDPQVLIHLGDIYYSGTPHECRENFLAPVEKIYRKGTDKAVYTLSGNHDMYSGGLGFYELVQSLNPEPKDQGASFFCLRSTDENWQLLALDTGKHDYSPYGVGDALVTIDDDELDWHVKRMEEFQGKTILLSHHQLFSAYSEVGPKLATGKRKATNPHLLRAFNELSAKGEISAWFWGHEHSLSIYQPFEGVQRGRCIGHGAIPVSIKDEIYKPRHDLDHIPELMKNTELGTNGSVWNHGFTLLSFAADTCKAAYYELNNSVPREVFTEEF